MPPGGRPIVPSSRSPEVHDAEQRGLPHDQGSSTSPMCRFPRVFH